MTPKEEAKELVDSMYNTEYCGIEHFPNKQYCDCSEINLYQAKQCALIAIDKILNTIEQIFETFEERKYWQEVKQEINSL